MMSLFVNNGRYVFVDPSYGGEGQNLDAGYVVPQQTGLTVGGAPIIEQSHEYVIRRVGPATQPGCRIERTREETGR